MGASHSTPKLGELLASMPKPSKSIRVERMLDGNCDYRLHSAPKTQSTSCRTM
jgi:hypothetical protein